MNLEKPSKHLSNTDFTLPIYLYIYIYIYIYSPPPKHAHYTQTSARLESWARTPQKRPARHITRYTVQNGQLSAILELQHLLRVRRFEQQDFVEHVLYRVIGAENGVDSEKDTPAHVIFLGGAQKDKPSNFVEHVLYRAKELTMEWIAKKIHPHT